jgi:hypothetical protein
MLTRLGIRARVAWHWMWILPTGYVFLLQAGSAGNDAFPVVYALAAIDFASRAWKSRSVNDVWLSLLAIALLGGAKASNLPLALPWLVLVLPLWKLLKEKPLGTARIAAMAIIISFLPTALLNISHCGSWSGLNLERPGMDMKNPIVGILGNTFLLLLNNLCPPFFPVAGWWNQNALGVLPAAIVQPLIKNFEDGFHFLWELATEDWAGIGPGVTVLMIISAMVTFSGFLRRKNFSLTASGIPSLILKLALISPWIALLAYCAKSGMVTAARLIAPYYPLLLPLLVFGAEQVTLVRRHWWRGLVYAVFVVAFVVLIVTPARPLWPAQTVLGRIVEANPDSRLLKRALTTYSVYAKRNDALADLRSSLPSNVKVVGFIGMPDDLDISFWRPFGERRVEQVSRVASAEEIRARNIQYGIVSKLLFEVQGESVDDWLARTQAEVLTNATFTVTVSAGPRQWYVVKFKNDPLPAKPSN